MKGAALVLLCIAGFAMVATTIGKLCTDFDSWIGLMVI